MGETGSQKGVSGSVTHSETNSTSLYDILCKYKEGSSKDYLVLVGDLDDASVKPETLVSYLRQLKNCMAMLDKEFEVLVGVILKIDWTTRGTSVVQEYQSFLVNLVSAHTMYLKACLRMIVKQFSPRLEVVKGETVEVDAALREKHSESFRHLHRVLTVILQIVPMSPTVLLPLLSDCFPFLGREAYKIECYVQNLLRLVEYLPAQRSKILEIIIDRMTKLDVQAPRTDIAAAEADRSDSEDEEDMDDETMFDMDEIDRHLARESPVQETSGPMMHKDADKLDILMDMMLSFIYDTCHDSSGAVDWEKTKKLYRELLWVFDKIILPTHASGHIQFVMFYICSFREALSEGFLDYLWKKAKDPNTETVFRQAAVAYIASMLARAQFISISMVCACMDLMVTWIQTYIQQAAYTTSKLDVAHHGHFYSVCQAVFYTIAFRHKEILSMKKGFKYVQGLNLQNIVTCRLNPLKFCLPIVARTFANITRMHQLAFCDTVLERNRRSLLPVEGTTVGNVPCTHLNPLDSFFPFDPYLLSRSKKFIHPLYREYEGTPVDEEEENVTMEEEDFYAEEAKAAEGALVISPDSLSKTPVSPTADFMMYGTSPGFKHG